MPEETIEAKERVLGHIFSDAYCFEIPDFQRPYTWTTDQVNDLLDDLEYAIGDGNKTSDKPLYFLGSIVIIDEPQENMVQVVDGQQRITTLTILMSALRKRVANKEFQEALTSRIRAKSDIAMGIKGEFRLRVRNSDSLFFRQYIQEIGGLSRLFEHSQSNLGDSQKRMYENAKLLDSRLSNYSQERLNSLIQFIVQSCYLVVVSASDQHSAYRIFSVLNDRGLDLSPTDILKAKIIGDIDDGYQKLYAQKWERLEENIGRDRFRDLFSHIRMIFMRSKMRGSLQQEFQDNVLNQKQGTCFIDEVLEPYADTYAVAISSQYGYDNAESVNKYLRYLNRLDNFDWIPPAMEILKRHPYDARFLCRFFQHLDRLAYGMFILRANINQRIVRYADVLRLIKEEGELFSANSPLQLSADEKLEIERVLDGQIYSHLRVRRPLLLRLNSLLGDSEVSYNFPIITIEHVLPQTPNSKWADEFPDEEERVEWTGKLANLVLLSRRKNSSAQNYDFQTKKRKYFQEKGVTMFALTTQVSSEKEWTPRVLKRRQKFLLDALRQEWRLC